MLHSVIYLESDDDGTIHQDAEDIVQRIAIALMKNAAELLAKGDIEPAAEMTCAIITVIENRMERVYDEGFSFQCIVKDTFELLTRISQLALPKNIAEKVATICIKAFESRDEDNRYNDDEWQKVISALRRLQLFSLHS